MSRSRNSRKGSKHQGCPAGRKCTHCADNRQFNTKRRKATAGGKDEQAFLAELDALEVTLNRLSVQS